MKKYILILFILFCSILLTCCSNSNSNSNPKTLLTPEIEQEIKSISADKIVSKYISVNRIVENSSSFTIWVEFIFVPQTIPEIKIYTDAVCEECYRILKNNNINISIYVHGYRPKDNDLTIMYGTTRYDKYSGKFTFEIAK